MVEYTSRELVSGVRVTDTPRYGHTVSGYGGRIPTRFMVNYDGDATLTGDMFVAGSISTNDTVYSASAEFSSQLVIPTYTQSPGSMPKGAI